MHYVDTSAFAKLLLPEPHAAALRTYLGRRPLVSSALMEIELLRAVARSAPARAEAAAATLRQVQLIPVDAAVITSAAHLPPAALRALDAIHLATALSAGDLVTSFVTYDRQLGAAAMAAGLTVAAPGVA